MIRFFISSTFDDMLGERELLHKSIVPQLNEYAKQFGEWVEVLDLRWGIDTSDLEEGEALYKITELCLKKIDDCDGCIVSFLGDRYGTVPRDSERIKKQWPKDRRLLESYEISITQLELEYGVLNVEDCSALCYFRTAQNSPENDKARCDELKDRLKSLTNGTKCKEYQASWNVEENIACDLGRFEQVLLEDLKAVVKRKAGENRPKNWIERERLISRSIVEKNAVQQAGLGELKQAILDEIHFGKASIIGIYGKSGSGKSTLLANLYEKVKENAFFISCGYGTRSKLYLDVLMQMIYAISGTVTNPATAVSAENLLETAVLDFENSSKGPFYIFIDAIDKISFLTESTRFESTLLGIHTKKIKFVFSGIDPVLRETDQTRLFEMKSLTEKDVLEIFEKKTEMRGSGIHRIIQGILQKKDGFTPLYVTNAINILKMNLSKVRGKSNGDIFDYFIKKVSELPETVNKLCCRYFCEAGTEYLNIPNHELFLTYIAATENGISKQDLSNLIPDWNELDFYNYLLYFDESFRVLPDGRILFSHDLIANSIKEQWGDRLETVQNEILYPYLKRNIRLDPLHLSDGVLLGAKNQGYEYLYNVFCKTEKHQNDKRVSQEQKNAVITELMSNLYTAYKRSGENGWFDGLVHRFPMQTMHCLLSGIRYDIKDSYARIIPATALSDAFFQILLDLDLSEKRKIAFVQPAIERLLSKWDLERSLDFCVFLCEYISAYEAIATVEECFPFEYVPFFFFCKQVSFHKLTSEQQDLVFSMVNFIFYSNNKYLNRINRKENPIGCTAQERMQAEEISGEIVNWYTRKIKNKGYVLKKEGAFLSNVGQYLNAMKRYRECIPFRRLALNLKIESFQHFFEDEAALLEAFCHQIDDETILISDFQCRFWMEFQSLFNARLEEMHYADELLQKWLNIAISYRTIATDCFYLSDLFQEENKQEKIGCLQNGIGFFKLCLFMQNNKACDDVVKEKIVTKIRLLGMMVKLCQHLDQITSDRATELCDLAENTSMLFARYISSDKVERKNLTKNLNSAADLPLESRYKDRLENTSRLFTSFVQE